MFDHGVPFRLSPLIRRLVAPNPGIMTGPGTNTYLIGNDEVAVLDPGPALPEHGGFIGRRNLIPRTLLVLRALISQGPSRMR